MMRDVVFAHLCRGAGQGGGDLDVALGGVPGRVRLAGGPARRAALPDLRRAAVQRARVAQQRPRDVQRRPLRAGRACTATLF